MDSAPEYAQNTWELLVQVDQREGDDTMRFKTRVKGDLHIGGLMLKLVEKISEFLFVRQIYLLSNKSCLTASVPQGFSHLTARTEET